MNNNSHSNGTVEISKALIGCLGVVLAAVVTGVFLLISTGVIRFDPTPLEAQGSGSNLPGTVPEATTPTQATSNTVTPSPVSSIPAPSMPTTEASQPVFEPTQPPDVIPSLSTQVGSNCAFFDELRTKVEVVQYLYDSDGQSLAGVQARLRDPIDVPVGWTVHKDGQEYKGPVSFEADIVASFWSPVSCIPLSTNG